MRRVALVAALLCILNATPAQAATVTVRMQGLTFQPATARARIGDTVAWSNGASDRHSSTSAGPTPWNSGNLAPWGGQYNRAFPIAGSFPYYCTLHRSLNMIGSIKVATGVTPLRGTRATTFTVTLAKSAVKPPAGFVYVLQRAIGSGAFTTIAKTTNASAAFKPGGAGTYKLRSGLQKSTGAFNNTWFGEPVTVTVS